MAEIEKRIADATTNSNTELTNCIEFVEESIKTFKEKVEFFQSDIEVTQTKFKRLLSDQDIFRDRVEKIHMRTKELVRVIRAEQLATSKILSTLVELEFIQQSLDFQDEFDKT